MQEKRDLEKFEIVDIDVDHFFNDTVGPVFNNIKRELVAQKKRVSLKKGEDFYSMKILDRESREFIYTLIVYREEGSPRVKVQIKQRGIGGSEIKSFEDKLRYVNELMEIDTIDREALITDFFSRYSHRD
jgi:hypothetical protein